MKIAITGANGFIGGNLCDHFLTKGDEIYFLQRKLSDKGKMNFVHFDLSKPLSLDAIASCDVLIHTAYEPYTNKNRQSDLHNLNGTLALEKFCKEKGIQFIFLSSYSAHEAALSHYGKNKFELEQKLDKEFTCILKLGLVIGDNGGLYKTMFDTIAKSPNIPLVGGGIQPIQTISLKELYRAVDVVVDKKIKGLLHLAEEKEISMKEFYSTIAKKQNKPIKFLYVSTELLLIGVRILEFVGIPFPIKSESILGLKRMKRFSSKSSQEVLGIKIESFAKKL